MFFDLMGIVVGDVLLGVVEVLLVLQWIDGSWLFDGLLVIDEMKVLFDIKELLEEYFGNYYIVGGFVFVYFGWIFKKIELFDWLGWYFEIMDMEKNWVDEILVICVVS